MLVGAIDPLEGWIAILIGVATASVGAYLGELRYRKLLYAATGLVAFGGAAMVVMSWAGGIGGHSGHSLWWGLFAIPYPVGWLLGIVGAVLALVELHRLAGLPKFGLQ